MPVDRLLVPYRRGMTDLTDPAAAVPPALRDAVLAWYAATGRELAFRATADPYAVLVSELMAQQTQAARAAAAWTAWMARFPTVAALATAPVAEVLRAWAGLGYNRRAVALQRAARVIVEEHGGEVPASHTGRWRRCPGWGRTRPGRWLRSRSGSRWAPWIRMCGGCSDAWRRADRRRSRPLRCRRWPTRWCPLGTRRALDARADGHGRPGVQAGQAAVRRLSGDRLVPVRGGVAAPGRVDGRRCADSRCRGRARRAHATGGQAACASLRDDEPMAPRPDPGAGPRRRRDGVDPVRRADRFARIPCRARGRHSAGVGGSSGGPRGAGRARRATAAVGPAAIADPGSRTMRPWATTSTASSSPSGHPSYDGVLEELRQRAEDEPLDLVHLPAGRRAGAERDVAVLRDRVPRRGARLPRAPGARPAAAGVRRHRRGDEGTDGGAGLRRARRA